MYNATEVAKKAREKWNGAICVRGKLSDHVKVETGRLPLRSSPVRWYADWEQIDQMLSFSLESIISYTDYGIEQEWSIESCKNFRKLVTPETFGLALVEMTAVVEGAKVFCQATYTLEGNDPLILTAYKVHDCIESEIEAFDSSISLVKTKRACKLASNHMDVLGVSTTCFHLWFFMIVVFYSVLYLI